jgi:pectate lyase-like protein
MKTFLVTCFAALGWASSAAAQILPTDRTTTWTPGVGTIPTRTTICATLNASTYRDGSQDASTAIQRAIDACPAGQVVLLSAGRFTVNNHVLISKGITLRGAGAGQTILTKTNGARARISSRVPVAPASYTYDAQPIVVIGPSRWPKIDSTSKNLTVDGPKGSTSVTVANATGLAAGRFVLIDELSGASWQPTPTGFPGAAKVWKGDRVAWNMHLPAQRYADDNGQSDTSGPYDLNGGTRTLPNAMSWFARPDRATNEIKEVASVSGTTVTFTTPLHITYRTSHAAQLTSFTGANALVRDAGVESLTTIGGADGQIRFENAAYSWAKNIENTQWLGEGFAIDHSFRIEVRDSYIHDGSWPEPGGAGYAISLANASSEVLIENNIIINACKVMVFRSSGAGTVVGYNYTDDSWDFDTPSWVEVGINASHMAGPHHVLFEGNYSPNADSDYTHGNAIYLTFFRNWLTGQRRSFTDTSNVRAVGLAYGSWWDSFVGNVLGRPGQMSGWVYEDPAMAENNANWRNHVVWKLGYDPERWGMHADPQTLSTVIRDGNYDYLTNALHWHTTPAGFTIPTSLYLTAKPAFFGASPWPWVDPTAGTTHTLPAKARYDAGTPNAPSSRAATSPNARK